MMRRTSTAWWARALTALFGVWVVVAMADLASAHVCPMHDGAMPAVSSDAAPMPGHAGHHMGGDVGTGEGHQPTSHACTCIGACCAVTIGTPVPVAVLSSLADVRTRERVVAAHVATPRVARIDHVLPFGTAPPVLHHV